MRLSAINPSVIAATALALFMSCGERGQDKGEAEVKSDPEQARTDGGEAKGDTKQPDGGAGNDDSTDVPAWVNAGYLTQDCSWSEVVAKDTASFDCALVDKTGKRYTPADGVAIAWSVVNGNTAMDATATAGADVASARIAQKAATIAASSAVATLSKDGATHLIKVLLGDKLEGMTERGKLASCFRTELSVADCFEAAGIVIPYSDSFKQKIKPGARTACEVGANKAGTPCELWTSAMVGDFDLATLFFQSGNELIAADDGRIQAERFCDSTGIKKNWEKGRIDRSSRFYPYWGDDVGICFEHFRPKKPATFEKRRILSNAEGENGRDGEPYCFFLLIEEPFFMGSTYTRMHIVLNSKLFPDAGNGSMASDKLEAMADTYKCIAK